MLTTLSCFAAIAAGPGLQDHIPICHLAADNIHMSTPPSYRPELWTASRYATVFGLDAPPLPTGSSKAEPEAEREIMLEVFKELEREMARLLRPERSALNSNTQSKKAKRRERQKQQKAATAAAVAGEGAAGGAVGDVEQQKNDQQSST